jgi:uncharacterized membrane protein YfcA
LICFLISGNVNFATALPMAACNIAGAILGARMAILRGNRFVRIVFLIVLAAIIIKMSVSLY